jgi:SAM-dependent methyltransferase
MVDFRKTLGRYAVVKASYNLIRMFKAQYGANLLRWITPVAAFVRDYRKYVSLGSNQKFRMRVRDIYPCMNDKTAITAIEPTYFFQDAWAAGKIFRIRPRHHYDVGSSVKTLGIISQFVPTTMVDIRPVKLRLDNFHFLAGSILALPFEDVSIESLSSLCVVEHIGLGRYGDDLDPWGSEKAIAELKRVLKKGGHLLISVPVDAVSRVCFNAHRVFTRGHVLELFKDVTLMEEQYIYESALHERYDASRGFGTGLFYFVK